MANVEMKSVVSGWSTRDFALRDDKKFHDSKVITRIVNDFMHLLRRTFHSISSRSWNERAITSNETTHPNRPIDLNLMKEKTQSMQTSDSVTGQMRCFENEKTALQNILFANIDNKLKKLNNIKDKLKSSPIAALSQEEKIVVQDILSKSPDAVLEKLDERISALEKFKNWRLVP